MAILILESTGDFQMFGFRKKPDSCSLSHSHSDMDALKLYTRSEAH